MIVSVCRKIGSMLAPFRRSSIELYEWQRADVLSAKNLPKGTKWESKATKTGELELTGFRMAHAVLKADFLDHSQLVFPSIGFLLQVNRIIDFGSRSNLRLHQGASNSLGDIAQSSLTARLGQGLSLLFAEAQGYHFVGHLESDPTVRKNCARKGLTRVADFMFETQGQGRMILESKASVKLPNNDPSRVKSKLKNALQKQVDPWMQVLTPSPQKGYAVYSCLREVGNSTPSALIYVDPPEERGDFQFELPPDWVRRNNYAAWLRLMELDDAARRLLPSSTGLDAKSEPKSEQLRICEVGGRVFALANLGRRAHTRRIYFTAGIEVGALEAICSAIRGDASQLLEYQAMPTLDVERPSSLQASVLGDGTFFGAVRGDELRDVRDFKL